MRRHVLIASAILPLLAAAPAFAQSMGGAPGMPSPPAPQQRPQNKVAPAPALPGLAGRGAAPVVPADPDAKFTPDEALFDAITRGDLPAARQAMASGASINSHNVLGQTPVEAAVDQGRTEIAYFLLAMRGPGSNAPISGTRFTRPAVGAGAPPPGATAPGGANHGRQASRAQPERAAAPLPAAPLAPRLWANDGGVPKPEIGFLGFDANRPG
ncbi:hypothetical protein IAI18_02810 [Acetobacteraceae bacterium H6797]|nr:hypothetical protein [Acetobacteraceae bacterium H6797]